VEFKQLQPQIKRRLRNNFIDRLQAAVLTDSNLSAEDRSKTLSSIDRLRELDDDSSGLPSREFDRSKFEQLRNAMGVKKGRAPVRVG
jgi:hypothetical protein